MNATPRILILGCNFAGLTVARLIRDRVGGNSQITVVDRKGYLSFIPNIPLEVWNGRDPQARLHLPFVKHLHSDRSRFLQAEVEEIDVETREVVVRPNSRPGAPSEKLEYDYLVIALGARLAFDDIVGFAEHGHTFTDTTYGDRIRRHLHGGGYRGGPIAIGSDQFVQGRSPKLPDLPRADAACEGPPIEIALAMAHWLEKRGLGGADTITLFTPAEVIAEDAGETILDELLPMFEDMGFGYEANKGAIREIHEDGVEFENGESIEAELAIIFPNWTAHPLLRDLPITDDQGFVITDLTMRNPDYPEVFAVGDAASVTVPKLGSIGHLEAAVCAKALGSDLGAYDGAVDPLEFKLVCIGDMGGRRAFYMHTDEWWGGDTAILRIGYSHHLFKVGFKESYRMLGGKMKSWVTETSTAVADRLAV